MHISAKYMITSGYDANIAIHRWWCYYAHRPRKPRICQQQKSQLACPAKYRPYIWSYVGAHAPVQTTSHLKKNIYMCIPHIYLHLYVCICQDRPVLRNLAATYKQTEWCILYVSYIGVSSCRNFVYRMHKNEGAMLHYAWDMQLFIFPSILLQTKVHTPARYIHT